MHLRIVIYLHLLFLKVQVPFDKYFKVEPLKSYHRVITMATFMRHLAPTIWPPSARRGGYFYYRQLCRAVCTLHVYMHVFVHMDVCSCMYACVTLCNVRCKNKYLSNNYIGSLWATFNIQLAPIELYVDFFY